MFPLQTMAPMENSMISQGAHAQHALVHNVAISPYTQIWNFDSQLFRIYTVIWYVYIFVQNTYICYFLPIDTYNLFHAYTVGENDLL